MSRLVLFTTDCCHLCDQAVSIVDPIAMKLKVVIEVVEITDNAEWLDKYGLTIPVLSDIQAGKDLKWPFDAMDVESLLASTV